MQFSYTNDMRIPRVSRHIYVQDNLKLIYMLFSELLYLMRCVMNNGRWRIVLLMHTTSREKYYLCKEVTYKIIDKSYLQYPACDIGMPPSNLSPIYRIISTWTFSARDKFLPRSPLQLGRASGPYWYGIIYFRINQEKCNPSLMKLNNTDDYWPLILVTSSFIILL